MIHSGSNMCPISQLPEDLLSDIFIIVAVPSLLPYDSSCSLPYEVPGLPADAFYELKTDQQPCILTYVCKEWRRVAFNTPRLWTTFCFGAGWGISEDEERLKQGHMLKAWLKLSKNALLSLSIIFNGDPQNAVSEELLHTISRWQVLEISASGSRQEGDHPSLIRLFEELCSGGAVNLQYLDYRNTTFGWGPSDLGHNLTLENLPNLKHITVSRWSFLISERFDQLQSIQIQYPVEVPTILDILDSIPSLTAFHVKSILRHGVETRISTHMSLEHLSLTCITVRDIDVFSNLRLPSLRSLELLLIGPPFLRVNNNPQVVFQPLKEFLSHSGQRMKRLVIYAPLFKVISIVNKFDSQTMPELRHLEIRSTHDDYRMMMETAESYILDYERDRGNCNLKLTSLRVLDRYWGDSLVEKRLVSYICTLWKSTPPDMISVNLGECQSGDFLLGDQAIRSMASRGTVLEIDGSRLLYSTEDNTLYRVARCL